MTVSTEHQFLRLWFVATWNMRFTFQDTSLPTVYHTTIN